METIILLLFLRKKKVFYLSSCFYLVILEKKFPNFVNIKNISCKPHLSIVEKFLPKFTIIG